MENAYLYHHGILGQKWGRHQGPPYPLGASDHSALEKKEGYKKSLGGGRNEKLYDRHSEPPKKRSAIHDKLTKNYSNYYQKKFKLSKEDADKEAEARYDTAKKIAIGLGVTIGAATAIYAARQIGRTYVDDVIKPGTTIQTLKHNPDHIDSGKHFFASYRNLDNFKYVGGFGKSQDFFGNPTGDLKKKVQMHAGKDIKIAGKWNGQKVFKELLKNPEFAKAAGTKDYEYFNTNGLVFGGNPDNEKAASMFYDALKKKGYGAVRDINDSKNSGFNTKAAIIFDKDNFRKAGNIINKKVSDIDPKEYAAARAAFNPMILADYFTKPGYVALGGSWAAGIGLNAYDAKVANKYRKKKNAEKINKS